MPAGKDGDCDIELTELVKQKDQYHPLQEGQCDEVKTIFMTGFILVVDEIDKFTASQTELQRRLTHLDLLKFLIKETAVMHSTYFGLHIDKLGRISGFVNKKGFHTKGDVASANKEFELLDLMINSFLVDRFKKSLPRGASRTRVSFLLEAKGLIEMEIAFGVKPQGYPDEMDIRSIANLPEINVKTVIFDSRWHVRRSISPWFRRDGRAKAQQVQFGLDQVHGILIREHEEGLYRRGVRREDTLTILASVSDRLLTHRKPVVTQSRRGTIKHTRSGSVFIKCLAKERNQYFLFMILGDLIKMYNNAVSENNRREHNPSLLDQFVERTIGDTHSNQTVAQSMLDGRYPGSGNAALLLDITRIVRAWVIVRYAIKDDQERGRTYYENLRNNFFSGTRETRREHPKLTDGSDADSAIEIAHLRQYRLNGNQIGLVSS